MQSRYHAPPFKSLLAQVRSCPSLNIVADDFRSNQLLKKSDKSNFLMASFLKSSYLMYFQAYQGKVDVYKEVTAITLQEGREHEIAQIEMIEPK
jgi:hypothetical protein